jgi:hypothetical protein
VLCVRVLTNGESGSTLCHQTTVGRQVREVRDAAHHNGHPQGPRIDGGSAQAGGYLIYFLRRHYAQLANISNDCVLWVLLQYPVDIMYFEDKLEVCMT